MNSETKIRSVLARSDRATWHRMRTASSFGNSLSALLTQEKGVDKQREDEAIRDGLYRYFHSHLAGDIKATIDGDHKETPKK